MRYEELLASSFECRCGRRHHVPVRRIIYADDAFESLGRTLGDLVEPSRIGIIADERTWGIAGAKALELLERAGWQTEHIIVADTEQGGPVCDDVTFGRLKEQLGNVDMALAVGCGVINDLTKWTAFERDIPYAVFATAATMNGFTAANIAATMKGVKTLVVGRAPIAVFADPSIIGAAPFELTAAGLGDAVAKSASTADWMMNHLFCGEYFCGYCSEMINELEPFYFEHPEEVGQGKPEAVDALFKALLYSGIAMTLVGTSAPASGGEHLLSHTLDMMSGVDGVGHDLHGRQVGVGTILASALYERILQIETPGCCDMPEDIDRQFWGAATHSVSEQYEQKRALFQKIREKIEQPKVWAEFVEASRCQVHPAAEIKNCLKAAGAAHTFDGIKCSRARLRDAMLHMHEIRKRPTVVDLAWMLGILPRAADEIIDRWLTV